MFLSVFRYTSKDEELRYARIVGIEQGVAMGVGEYDVFDAVQRDFRGVGDW